MKSFDLKFLIKTVILFGALAFFLDVAHISPFTVPLLPLFFALISYEKNRSKKMGIIIFAMLTYSQLGTPLPLTFLVIISALLLLASSAIFKITSFDIEIVISIAVITNISLVFSAYAILILRNSGTIPFGEIWMKVLFPSLLTIAIVIFFQYPLHTLFKRDTWL